MQPNLLTVPHQSITVLTLTHTVTWTGEPTQITLAQPSGGSVSWACASFPGNQNARKQQLMMSSSEAEYMAASNLCKEIICPGMFLEQLGHKQHKPTVVQEDNNPCMVMTLNLVACKRSKQICMHRNYICEKVESGLCTLIYCSTTDQLINCKSCLHLRK